MHRVIIAMEIGLLLYTRVATLYYGGINVKRWSVLPPGFTLQNDIDCFIACGASVTGGFMDDGELMLQKSYGKLGTSVTGDLMKHGVPRLQEVLRKIRNDYCRRTYERWDLMLQVVLRKLEAYILGDLMEHWELVLQDVLWETAYFCYKVS